MLFLEEIRPFDYQQQRKVYALRKDMEEEEWEGGKDKE